MKTKATFIALGLSVISACAEKVTVLQTETVSLNSPQEVIPLEDTLVKPVVYNHIPDFNNLPVPLKKEKFIATVLPGILVAKYQIEQDRARIAKLGTKSSWTKTDSLFYNTQNALYHGSSPEDLLKKMQTHPNSIVLAQAIVESGWGSSRFFRQANNLFGIWSYNTNEPRIPSRFSRKGKKIYVRKYGDVSQSIEDYFRTVARSHAYESFRSARENTSNVDELLPHLKYYSERREAYVHQLAAVIRQNDLTQYDHYRIDPAYFKEEESTEHPEFVLESTDYLVSK